MKPLASTLKSIGVIIDDKELEVGVRNGFLKNFEYVTVVQDALRNDEEKFTEELFKSRILQEEQRLVMTDTFQHDKESWSVSNCLSRARECFQKCFCA